MATRDSLKEITKELGSAYRQWKSGEKEKDKHKKEFYEAIDASFEESDLASQVVTVAESDETKARERIERSYPTFDILEVREDEDGFSFVLIERRDTKSFTFVNEEDGKVYARIISVGSPVLEEKELEDADPELYKQITEVQRVLKPLTDLTEEQLEKIKPYIHPGRIQAKLAPPRDAKPEELE